MTNTNTDTNIQTEAKRAFENAIASGRLSLDKTASNFAGAYMYMGTDEGKDFFKHSITRQYI